jgi:hypothetical protein
LRPVRLNFDRLLTQGPKRPQLPPEIGLRVPPHAESLRP